MKTTLCLLALSLVLAQAQVPADLVTFLPGVGTPNVTMYSGYLNFTSSVSDTTRHMHYVFIECTNGSAADSPTVLWLNGGPGCSSLDGLFNEMGPYLIKDGQWYVSGDYNPNTWVAHANILYLESPVNVGFSFDNEDSNPQYNDFNTAQDNLASVQKFFEQYAYLNKSNFWIAGESYAGMYVPFLAYWMVSNQTDITLRGILVGNGVAYWDSLFRSEIDYLAEHSFLSTDLQNLTYRACSVDFNSPSCRYAQAHAATITSYQNPYNVYGECFNITAFRPPTEHEEVFESYKKAKGNKFERTPWYIGNPEAIKKLGAPNKLKKLKDSEGKAVEIICTWDLGIYAYLNDQATKTELHVNSSLEFQLCERKVSSVYDKSKFNGTDWVLPHLKEKGIKILIFNGDADAVVPYVDFYKWFPGLNWGNPKRGWRAWYAEKNSAVVDVSGFVVEWDGLTFATVRGAGHMVPQYKPVAALHMFKNFLNGNPL